MSFAVTGVSLLFFIIGFIYRFHTDHLHASGATRCLVAFSDVTFFLGAMILAVTSIASIEFDGALVSRVDPRDYVVKGYDTMVSDSSYLLLAASVWMAAVMVSYSLCETMIDNDKCSTSVNTRALPYHVMIRERLRSISGRGIDDIAFKHLSSIKIVGIYSAVIFSTVIVCTVCGMSLCLMNNLRSSAQAFANDWYVVSIDRDSSRRYVKVLVVDDVAYHQLPHLDSLTVSDIANSLRYHAATGCMHSYALPLKSEHEADDLKKGSCIDLNISIDTFGRFKIVDWSLYDDTCEDE